MFVSVCVCRASVHASIYVCVCAYVRACVREREREKECVCVCTLCVRVSAEDWLTSSDDTLPLATACAGVPQAWDQARDDACVVA